MADFRTARYHSRCIYANLVAGAKLALGLRVDLVAFRVSIEQFLFLNLLLLAIALVDKALQVGAGAHLNLLGIVLMVFNATLFALLVFGLAHCFGRPNLSVALLVILSAGELPIDLASLCVSLGDKFFRSHLADNIGTLYVLLAWSALTTLRGISVALGPATRWRWLRALSGAAALTAVSIGSLYILPYEDLWQVPDEQDVSVPDDDLPHVTSEEVLVAQPQLLDDTLSALKLPRPGMTNLYFVGFASYASQDVFRKDVASARDLFDRRFDTAGRSVLLVNNRRTLLESPLATVTNLRKVLQHLGAIIHPDQDVVFIYLSSHGSRDHELTVEFEPLDLEQVTPQNLKSILTDSGIKWKVVVVSSCYSGGFIEPLEDPYTLVISAAQADRSSFGCSNEADFTYFGDAYFHHALQQTDSFVDAFALAKLEIAGREKREGVALPSNPQVSLGNAMAEKLAHLQNELVARRGKTPTH